MSIHHITMTATLIINFKRVNDIKSYCITSHCKNSNFGAKSLMRTVSQNNSNFESKFFIYGERA
jgi:hypothetical protein